MNAISEKACELIEQLGLLPHPEGGHYLETYRGQAAGGKRAISTAIYFLLTDRDFSAFHRIDADEIFHFYDGDSVELVTLDGAGNLERRILGPDIRAGQRPQLVVSGGLWQGLRVLPGGSYALLGTTVAPGFAFETFELANRRELSRAYPEHEETIRLLTR